MMPHVVLMMEPHTQKKFSIMATNDLKTGTQPHLNTLYVPQAIDNVQHNCGIMNQPLLQNLQNGPPTFFSRQQIKDTYYL